MKTECSSFFISTADWFLMLPSPVLWTESSRYQWQWKVFFLQVVGMVTTVHWYIVCFIAGCWRAEKMCSLSPGLLFTVPLKGTLCDRSMSRLLKWAHLWTHIHTQTHMHTCSVRGSRFHSLLSLPPLWLSFVAGDSSDTCGDPGTPAHASREAGTFKVRSKVRFTCSVGHTLYGSAERICFPNGTWSGRQPFCKRKQNLKCFCDADVPLEAQFGFAFGLQWNKNISGLSVFYCIKYVVKYFVIALTRCISIA